MEALTYDRAVELAREIVAEFGEDYVYPEDHKKHEYGDDDNQGGNMLCVYVHNDQPSCIVGQILHKHGVSIEELKEHEFRGASTASWATTEAEEKARFFLSEVQSQQDRGYPWGSSLTFALDQVGQFYR
jgi:hypothetical protein